MPSDLHTGNFLVNYLVQYAYTEILDMHAKSRSCTDNNKSFDQKNNKDFRLTSYNPGNRSATRGIGTKEWSWYRPLATTTKRESPFAQHKN
jgi:hypothetical protein